MTAQHQVDLADLTMGSFLSLVEESFIVPSQEDGIAYCELRLLRVKKLANHANLTREPFSLIFHGPLEKPLGQMSYPMRNSQLGQINLFIVPVGKKDNGFEYEAIFN